MAPCLAVAVATSAYVRAMGGWRGAGLRHWLIGLRVVLLAGCTSDGAETPREADTPSSAASSTQSSRTLSAPPLAFVGPSSPAAAGPVGSTQVVAARAHGPAPTTGLRRDSTSPAHHRCTHRLGCPVLREREVTNPPKPRSQISSRSGVVSCEGSRRAPVHQAGQLLREDCPGHSRS